MGKILELFESIKFFYDNKIKKVDLEIKKTVILLGDGFFARGFLHTINFSNYHVTQIYRDAFINPQDMMHSLQNKKEYVSSDYKHFRDIITNCPNAGVLLTGREHYFGSDIEMAECLGLVSEGFLKLKCPDEFSAVPETL